MDPNESRFAGHIVLDYNRTLVKKKNLQLNKLLVHMI